VEFVGGSSWEFYARASGIVAALLAIIGVVLAGNNYPGANASAADITTYYTDHRTGVFVVVCILNISTLFFLWFLGAIVSSLREAGFGGWAATAIGFGTARAGFLAVHATINAALAYNVVGKLDPGVVQGLHYLTWSIRVLSLFPIAALIWMTGVAFRRAGMVPAWFGWAAPAGAVVVFAGATTWARSGFWAPDGAYGYISVAVALAWMFTMSGLLLRQPASESPGVIAAPRPAR
jgi:hypothetical protein